MQLELASRAADGPVPEALDVQVLHGLDTFLATERFLSKLEQARAEWIDLSEHAHSAACAHAHGATPSPSAPHGAAPHGAALAAAAAAGARPASTASDTDSEFDAAHVSAPAADASGSGSSGGATAAAAAAAASMRAECAPAAAAAAAAVGDFVVIDKDDAVEAMAYYIAMYISRLPEAQGMGPKELQSALREAFAVLRRSRWRLVWSWGRLLYRSAAVSFSALQLYNNPWLLRAVLSALWSSSRLLYNSMV